MLTIPNLRYKTKQIYLKIGMCPLILLFMTKISYPFAENIAFKLVHRCFGLHRSPYWFGVSKRNKAMWTYHQKKAATHPRATALCFSLKHNHL